MGEHPSYNAGVIACATAGLKIAEGDHEGAYELLLRCWRDDASKENRYYHRHLAPDLVRLAQALGHDDVAAEVADAVAAGAALAPEVPTVCSLALRCRGLVDADADALLEAVAIVAPGAAPGRARRRLRGRGAAADPAWARSRRRLRCWARPSIATSGRAPTPGPAGSGHSCGTSASIPGDRRPRNRPTHGWESLTETERAVSLLVAEGLTNGAVARRLYMSPHTVNTHLRHVFAKLGVSNRVALAGIVHRSIE